MESTGVASRILSIRNWRRSPLSRSSQLSRVSVLSMTTEVMRTQYTRHLLVEDQGEVIGIISMRDVIQLMLDDKQFLIEQLQCYIDGR